ncbi:uncharacterized protein TNIN_21312 [Trichonephila inaurata madagascariensis]|uniref:Uncharacterized protein n=1 Tax=Trichonephila inaurata madagascariensis TaxID=2747483 RepID=A0A8X6X4L5_9ARAC|nr:uncharacterized protein TNIN_21312 [Trichonephila inaurata madagascariensis]
MSGGRGLKVPGCSKRREKRKWTKRSAPSMRRGQRREKERDHELLQSDTMAPYVQQVDEPTSFVEGPPPAYTKGYSVKLQLFRLAARTFVLMIALIGSFVLLSAYIRSTSNTSCMCPDFSSRSEPEPLIAEPSTSDFKLHIGEDLKKAKDKHHLDCLVEKKQHVLDAMPPTGKAKIQIKGEQTIISCGSEKGKRNRRSAPCDCHCAC